MRPQAPLYLREHLPPHGLRETVLRRIVQLERRRALMRAGGFLVLLFASLGALAQAWAYTADELYLSGFGDYVRLLVTDSDAVLSSWREFALSLLESLPLTGLILLGAALLLFIGSAARLVRDARTVLHPLSA